MRTASQLRAAYDSLVGAYLDFLLPHGRRRAQRWRSDVSSEQPEGHLFEAAVWRALVAHGVAVAPVPEGRTRDVDFECCGPTGAAFYVEARGRLAQSLAASTGIQDDEEPQGGWFDTPAKDICELVRKKEAQASRRADAPVLVAVGSLHRWAGMVVAPVELGMLHEVAAPEAEHYAFAGTPSIGGLLWLPSQATWPGAPESAAEYGLSGLVNSRAHRPFDPAALPSVAWAPASG